MWQIYLPDSIKFKNWLPNKSSVKPAFVMYLNIFKNLPRKLEKVSIWEQRDYKNLKCVYKALLLNSEH